MGDELLYKLSLKQGESNKIHNELFKATTEYQYYLCGIATGLCSVCDMLNRISEDENINIEFIKEIVNNIINNIVTQEEDVNKYFQRLVKDIRN